MRYLFGVLCVCALGVVPLVGCSETAGTGGSGGDGGGGGAGGDGGTGGSNSAVFPCNEQGINDAIALGGGPHTFDCVGAQTVVTEAEIVIDNDVVLDGEGNLTVSGDEQHGVFQVLEGVTAALRDLVVTDGGDPFPASGGAGIWNHGGNLSLTGITVSNSKCGFGCVGGGIRNGGTLLLVGSTVSGNLADAGGGIHNDNEATMTLVNSTVSGNSGGAISNQSTLELINSTLLGDFQIMDTNDVFSVTITNTLIIGMCALDAPDSSPRPPDSGGYNIESPGDTCGFDQTGDQPGVTAEALNLGELANNGGPTLTHKPGAGGFGFDSAAIDKIPEAACDLDSDQRGQPRPRGPTCDVGSVEVGPAL